MTPDLTDISQQETTLEESARQVFAAADIYAVTRTNVQLQTATPRVEIKARVGAATGKRDVRGSTKTMNFSAWYVEYALQTVVAKSNDGTNALPMAFLGAVRDIMRDLAQNSWTDTTNFPNLILAEPLKDSGTNLKTNNTDGFEYATCGYSGISMIRNPAAW